MKRIINNILSLIAILIVLIIGLIAGSMINKQKPINDYVIMYKVSHHSGKEVIDYASEPQIVHSQIDYGNEYENSFDISDWYHKYDDTKETLYIKIKKINK